MQQQATSPVILWHTVQVHASGPHSPHVLHAGNLCAHKAGCLNILLLAHPSLTVSTSEVRQLKWSTLSSASHPPLRVSSDRPLDNKVFCAAHPQRLSAGMAQELVMRETLSCTPTLRCMLKPPSPTTYTLRSQKSTYNMPMLLCAVEVGFYPWRLAAELAPINPAKIKSSITNLAL